MKALVKTTRPMEFTVEDRSIPQLKEDELLIRVSYCGVCGSDLHAATHAKGYEFVPFPIVFGHEFSGIVTEVGSTNYNELSEFHNSYL